MGNYTVTESSSNIVLVDVDFFSNVEFEIKFNGLKEEDEKIKELSFKKTGINFRAKTPLGEEMVIPSPISKFEDESKTMVVEYRDNERKLIISTKNNERIETLKQIAKSLLQEQSSKITGMGFNFQNNYVFEEKETIKFMEENRIKIKENVLSDREARIAKLDQKFIFEENNFVKTFNVDQNMDSDKEYAYIVKANYHYDEFSTVKSTSRIRTIILDLINENYSKYQDEFELISDRIINL